MSLRVIDSIKEYVAEAFTEKSMSITDLSISQREDMYNSILGRLTAQLRPYGKAPRIEEESQECKDLEKKVEEDPEKAKQFVKEYIYQYLDKYVERSIKEKQPLPKVEATIAPRKKNDLIEVYA